MNYKRIPQYPAYEVSECGKVVRRIDNQKPVKQSIQLVKRKPSGYYYCTLTWDENGQYLFPLKRVAVHRLVAFAWLPEPREGKVWVNHIDGNKGNNHKGNLEWTSISENIQHAHDTGLKVTPKGAEHWRYGLKAKIETRNKQSEAKKGAKHPKFKGYYFVNFKRYESATQAGKELNINPKTVASRCKSGKWRLEGWYFLPV